LKVAKEDGSESMTNKLLIFTCYGGCATGVSASGACIRIWEGHPDEVKIGGLPAVFISGTTAPAQNDRRRRIILWRKAHGR